MRIATFNINNVVKRLPNLLAWLADTGPDVVCLQELKATDAAFPAAELEAAGYGAVWSGQRTWNGVAILARGATPIVTRYELPGDPADEQARYIEAAVRGVLVASIYAPNGNPNPGPKFAYKLAWLERLTAHAAELMASGAPVALAGDYNVVPTEADIYQPNSWAGDALIDPAARAAFATLLAQGWTDSLLALSSPVAISSPPDEGEATRSRSGRAGGGLRRPPPPSRRRRGRGTAGRSPVVEGAQSSDGRQRASNQRRRQQRPLDLLVLPAPPLGKRPRPADRPHPPQPHPRAPPEGRRRRQTRPRRGRRQRPRPHLDRPHRLAAPPRRATTGEGDHAAAWWRGALSASRAISSPHGGSQLGREDARAEGGQPHPEMLHPRNIPRRFHVNNVARPVAAAPSVSPAARKPRRKATANYGAQPAAPPTNPVPKRCQRPAATCRQHRQ